MTACIEQLNMTGGALRDALERQDWQAIGTLDRQCRQLVEQSLGQSELDENLLRGHLQQLLTLYRELVDHCQLERGRLMGELMQLQQSKQSAKVYQMFGT